MAGVPSSSSPAPQDVSAGKRATPPAFAFPAVHPVHSLASQERLQQARSLPATKDAAFLANDVQRHFPNRANSDTPVGLQEAPSENLSRFTNSNESSGDTAYNLQPGYSTPASVFTPDGKWTNSNGLSDRAPSAEMLPVSSTYRQASEVPMGFPPNFTGTPRFIGPPGPPVFDSPIKPIASPSNQQGLQGNLPFSEIPISPARGRPLPFAAANGREDQAVRYPSVPHNDYDSFAASASTSFVLFTSRMVLKEKRLANTASLGFGALITPGKDIGTALPTIHRDAFRCHNCGAYPNPYCSIEPNSGQWKCVLCSKRNSTGGEYRVAIKDELQNWSELVTTVVDYVDVGTRRPGFVPVSDSTMAAPIIVLIDESLDEAHLQHLQSSLHSFFDSLSPLTRIGIVSYGKTVSIYDLSEVGLAAADIIPGDISPSQDFMKMLIYGTGVYLAPIHACLQIAQMIVSSLRPYRGKLPEFARERCLGTAIDVALALIQGPSTDLPRSMVKRSGGSNRILVCAGGPNTIGPGAVPPNENNPNHAYLKSKAIKYMEHCGMEARRLDTAVDIFCAGTCPVNVQTLQPLVKASGGVLILHDDFGEAFGLNMQRAVRRAKGFRGILEVRCTDDIAVTRIVGPGEEAGSDASESFRNDTSVSLEMLSVEESQGFALVMTLSKNLTDDYVYFQFVVRFTNAYQANVTRVITVRLSTTNSVSTYLQSVNDEVAAVLISKKTVLEAKTASDAAEMRLSVDERIKDISLKFGKQMPRSKLRLFPTELSRIPELLFHLRRGPLLGSIVGHEDERAILRNLFLQASFDLALRMLSPRVLMYHEGGAFEEIPAHSLAMQSDTALVLDHGTDIFIWTGQDITGDELRSAATQASCRTLAHELIELRFPAPRTVAFKEGSSQSRYLQARLIPAHKDPPYEQEVRFPQLRSLRPDQRAKLKAKFFHTDDLSFCEWMRSLKLVPPEPGY
ncbi:hypothetical protein O6H91_03G112300 [Diphasiastrum complanatum]|uniref:Uncharacterized protein n=1 Tax=Diphasiastrum complanatum TaxID=34168 RepID=A0ACC2EAV0_DIPCM|nr:hypothetical protein O6H91_03G112300 [Diphasiastrum complanatum]